MSDRADGSRMRIVYFGSGAFGLPTLQRLSQEHDLTGIVTQPDKPAGRKRKLTPTPVGEWAAEHAADVPIFKPSNVNVAEVREAVRALEADAWVVIAFGQKLGQELLRDRFSMNLHASLLPRWRGAAPINHAILAGDEVTGNSVITLAERMDAGLVLGQSERAIEPTQTAGELHDLLAADGPPLVLKVLDEKRTGALMPVEQAESLVTIAGKLSKSDGWVDFGVSAEECRRRVHGLTPWPGVSVAIEGYSVKLLRVETLDERSEEEGGTIMDAERGVVACAGGTTLRLIEVQPAGKRAMAWSEFARGRSVKRGMRIEGGPSC